jgi:tetratricopeptide (TPR) repeat protein
MYYNEGDFLNALKENEKVLELNPDFKWGYSQKFRIYYHLGEYDKAIEAYLKFQEVDTPDKDYSNEILKVYSENGIDEVIIWIIKTRVVPPELREYVADSVNHFGIARYYGMLGNRDSAIAHLELEYKQGHSVNLDRIKYSYDFKFLHGNPKFNALLKKMNLSSD